MASLLAPLRRLFGPKQIAASPVLGSPSPRRVPHVDGLDEERQRYEKNLAEIRAYESRNRLAWSNHRLEVLRAAGTPVFDRPDRQEQAPTPNYVPVPVYAPPGADGYPFRPAVHWLKAKTSGTRYEQDPLFGWGIDSWDTFNEFGNVGTNVPVSAFPREMFPERPSTLRTQIAQDAIRFMSRAWFETMPQYSGCIGHLVNYVVGSGLVLDVVSDRDKQLAQDVMDFLDEVCKHKWNNLDNRIVDSALNLFRDGEDALRVLLIDGEEYPQFRSVDTSTVRGPHNEITGPWAYGVLTSWPDDYEDVRAYHIWKADNTHESVSPDVMSLCKLETTGANVKRGVPLAYRIRKQLPQLSKLMDCMAIGEAARQAIPYVQQYNMADKSAVGAAFRENETGSTPNLFGDWDGRHGDIEPGEVRHINKGQEFVDPPNAQGFAASGSGVYRTLCEAVACALNVPIWMVTGTADSENYASSLVSESPVVKRIQRAQRRLTDHFKSMFKAAVMIGVVQGRFPSDVLKTCNIHVELPTPIARNRKDEVETDLKLLDKGILAPQHLAVRNDLDFDEERELIELAKLEGWKNEMGVTQGERPAAQEGPEGVPVAETGNESRHEQWQAGFSQGFNAATTRFEAKDAAGHEHVASGEKGGQFTGSGQGGKKAEKIKAAVGHAAIEHGKAKTAKEAAKEPAPLKLTRIKQRAFTGKPIATKTQLGKSETGKVGEAIIISYCKMIGKKDARHLNLDRNNFPIDLVQDHESIEAKAGLVSNRTDTQRWRLTIGEPGKAEKEWLKTASPEAKAKWNQQKQAKITERKKKCLADLSKKLGQPIKAATMTCIINPDTKTADIFKFDGWHDRIGWRSEEAQAAYVATVHYE